MLVVVVVTLWCALLLQKVEDSEQDSGHYTDTPPSPAIIGSLKPVVQLRRLDMQRSL